MDCTKSRFLVDVNLEYNPKVVIYERQKLKSFPLKVEITKMEFKIIFTLSATISNCKPFYFLQLKLLAANTS